MASPSLKQANIELRDIFHSIYGCLTCGKAWTISLGRSGRRPRDWWKCPNGCNADVGKPRKRQR